MPLIPSDPLYIATVMNSIAHVQAQQHNSPPTIRDIHAQTLPMGDFSRTLSIRATESPTMSFNSSFPIYDEPQTTSPTVLLRVSPATDNSIYSMQIRRNQRSQRAFQMMVQEQRRILAAEQQRITELHARIAEYTRRMTSHLQQELQNTRFQELIREAVRTYTPQQYAEYFSRISNEQMIRERAETRPTEEALTPEPEIEEPEDGQIQEPQRHQQTLIGSVDAAADQGDDDLEVIDITSQTSETEDLQHISTEDEIVYRGRQSRTNTFMSPTLRRPEQETFANRRRGSNLPVRTTSIQELASHRVGKSRKRSFTIFDEYDPSNSTVGSLGSRKRHHISHAPANVVNGRPI